MSAVALIKSDQLKAIHTLKSKAGLDDGAYRDMLAGFGASSSKALTAAQAGSVIERLRSVAPRSNRRAVPMTGRYGPKIRALWIAGWNLGVVRDRTDEAACAFVERQTGVMRTAWLVEPGAARAAIEALKSWLAREAGVEWPGGHDVDPVDHKIAVLEAQWRRLVDIGVVKAGSTVLSGLLVIVETHVGRELRDLRDPSLTPAELDGVSVALGRRIRKALGRVAS